MILSPSSARSGRDQGQGGGDRGDDDQDGAGAERAEDRVRHQDQAEQGEDDGHAGEEDRAGGGAAGELDRVELGPAAPPLLAVALDDEEGVVDADREADHRDHVGDEEREVEEDAQDGGQAEGDEDADDRQGQRQDRRQQGGEDDDQDEEGDHPADRLAGGQVLLGDGVELFVDADRPDREDREAVAALLLDRREVVGGVVAGLLDGADEADRE